VISVEKVTEEQPAELNAFVQHSPYSSIYQSYEWGEVKRAEGWDVLRLVARNERTIVGSLSCLSKKLPIVPYRIYYAPRGPVIDYDSETAPEVFQAMVSYLRSSVLDRKAVFLRISPDIHQQHPFERLVAEEGFLRVVTPILHTSTMRLDLRQDENSLLASMESRTRYDIRRATKDGVRIDADDGTEEFLVRFYQLLHATSKRNGFPIYSFDTMRTIWIAMRPKNFCRIYLSRRGDSLLSGAFVFVFGGKCIYQWGGSENQGTKVNPNQLMHWEIIRAMKAVGCTSYDFQGIPDSVSPEHPLWGIYLFKRGFGSTTVKLAGEYDLVQSRAMYAFWKALEPLYPKLKQALSGLGGK
jgi:peptidoglycan pentaglycine glycine transferase (the first glycine)